ncbi:hypothetical protein [Thalassospira alkalitolerans]|uniref:Uncharacterized protein n=1 Tax=Thalassospira alkalitolerans TaxID=1293890 RepID=A0A1Y2LFA2_9PROT|nr:hypothetical protein [Thalassospira alkalitolerans]OSQ48877.1 hypothetical protein TALK_08115 [Thalassospira alkalitolerans]
MKTMMVLGIGVLFALGVVQMQMPVNAAQGLVVMDQTIEHGGGCRKSSPPGQCCHMDNKAGSVHCH